MIRENDDRCVYRCNGCGHEMEESPIGTVLLQRFQCPRCDRVSSLMRPLTIAENEAMNALIEAWFQSGGVENSQFPRSPDRRTAP